MDYSALSDFDINKRVALLCTIEGVVINSDGDPVRNIIDESPGSYSGGDYFEVDYDPCNNPADAWPIIVGSGISLYHNYGEWEAEMEYDAPVGAFGTDETCCKRAYHKNPLRAAMVVFLMMQDK
ncbi:hypothetical protein ABW09_24910 [Pluralibacter gergoviae]|uniref:phage protein NinX family protein n=1 Tax=Pluralibacter gergoviae TaxID=61647 RepID=UPI000650E771|nr:phage protein NinX family protein [Pluralibacter gergoviae]KMK11016.1 hypothetical protein ABW09_24910 [Pluralibacter gergoviae]